MNLQQTLDSYETWLIDGINVVDVAEIDDYPIGGRNRGQCKLSVDFDRKRGFRTARTTTDKHGRWCKPKLSIYHQTSIVVPVIIVAQPPDADEEHALSRSCYWLHMSTMGVLLQHANYDWTVLVANPGQYKHWAPTEDQAERVCPIYETTIAHAWSIWQPWAHRMMRDIGRRWELASGFDPACHRTEGQIVMSYMMGNSRKEYRAVTVG